MSAAWVTISLFVAGVLATVPLLQRDLQRAVERQQFRERVIRFDFTVIDRASAALRAAGISTALAGSRFKSMIEAARYAEKSMARVAAVMNVRPHDVQYRLRLQHERALAEAHLHALLDDWCRGYGWDPVEVWRQPRWLEAEQQVWRDRDRIDAMLLAYVGMQQLKTQQPSAFAKITDVTS